MFVTTYDYQAIIREAVKTLVTNGNDQHRLKAESFAQEEMTSYLRYDYDVSSIFSFRCFELIDDQQQKKGDLLISSTGDQYVCIQNGSTSNIDNTAFFIKDLNTLPAPIFDSTQDYTAGSTVKDADGIAYLCIQNTVSGIELNDTDYFFLKRNDLMVMLFIDISIYHYHARTSTNQTPQIRIDRYLDAIAKLKAIRMHKMQPAIPKVVTAGQSSVSGIEMFSNKKRDNNW